MHDSDDDYFSGDLVLDDKTVAVLDEQESKFRRNSTQPQQSTAGPPAKRQKTTGSWQPQPMNNRVLRRADTVEDTEDLPDVSIRQDGTYGLQDKQRPSSGPPTSRSGIGAGSNIAAYAGPVPRPSTTVPPSRGLPPPARGTPVTAPARTTQFPPRPSSSVQGTRVVHSPVSSQEVVPRTQYAPPQRVNRVSSTPASGGGYVGQLLQQIEELRKNNEMIKVDMESARDVKFAKEGEVTILRKRLEKATQEHLAQVAKLKAAKDESEVTRVSMQKQYETDKERLKTELTFKRHELEASSRKHSVPLLPKNEGLQTADPLPSQRQRSGQWNSAGPSRPVPETPRHPRFGVISEFEKPKKSITVETRELLSGFQAGPPRSQTERKGKETTSFGVSHASPVIPSASQGSSGQFRQPEVFTQVDDGGPIEDFLPLPLPQADVGADDVRMIDEGTPALTLSSQENTTILGLPSWNLMLHDIMLKHTLQGSKLPTLQLLVCASPADIGQVQSYTTALMRIFDTLGSIPAQPDRDFDLVARTICCALCEITELLARNNLVSPLTAVLNLLTNLAYVLPLIHALLLSQRAQELHETPQLLGVLHDIIQNQLQKQNPDITSENEPPELRSLGKETLSLYEALVWWIFDDLEDTLSACPGMPSLLTTLLHPHRPLWFLIKSMRILLWLSTRRSLFRLLLSCPASEQTGTNGEPVGHSQISLACFLLTDTDRQGPEADELKSHIIMFFGMLSIAHPDAYTLLVESQELIPSIVLYLHHLVGPIWDENGVLDDPQALTRKVHIINHTTLLLHHLVIGEDATLDLRERLLRAPAKTYQGLVQFFILTLGRLSYANPPYWLGEKDRQRLMQVADLARALLERVIQGPELDLIWETYQDDGEENNEAAMDVDDEEVEAQKIADS